ncbi:MAG: nucleotidyltransferase domain-containing protein [Candidatus Nanohalobium sp.]
MKIASQEDIEEFVDELREVVGDSFEKAVLYGSYARNEHDTGSDIDLAIIVSGEVDEDKVFELVDDYRHKRDLAFSPRFFTEEEFETRLEEGYNFYENVDREGVEI